MTLKNVSSACVVALFALAVHAQAPTAPAPPQAPPAPGAAAARPARPVNTTCPGCIAGLPVNYDESKVGTYTLPDVLKLDNGQEVKTAKEWMEKRRPEVLKMIETQQYGVMPPRPKDESFEVTDKGTPALDGKAIRKQITIHLSKDPTWPPLHVLEYLPANAKGPVPMYLDISFGSLSSIVSTDKGITPTQVRDPKTNKLVDPTPGGRGFGGNANVGIFLDAGIGYAAINYTEIDPDTVNGFAEGIRALYLKPGQPDASCPPPDSKETVANEVYERCSQGGRPGDAWGSISAWAWALSRVEDYFETDKQVDAKRVAIHGVSRLGKTVTWAGAYDQRFAAVIASCGGEGGAALSHRDYGETIAHLTAVSRYPYQFAANYARYDGFPDNAPFDSHFILALIAPRPILMQTGSTDNWSDPEGEFLAGVAAGPVYKLLGKGDLGTTVWPKAKTPLFSSGLNYYMHDGGHGMVPTDYDIYVQFLKAQFHPEQ